MSELRILSLSLVFPNPASATFGVFIRSRLQYMAAHAEIKVLAPVAAIDYSHIRATGKWGWGSALAPRRDGRIEVFHPRWLYLPGLGFLNPLLLFLRLLPALWILRRRYHFQAIDAHFGHPMAGTAALLAKVFGCPFAVTLRGDEPMHAGGPLRRAWMRWALHRAGRVIAVSERLRQFAIGLGVDPARAKTISNGIDTAVFFPRDRLGMRAKLGIPPGALMILSAGFLIERKGHHRAVAALRGVRDSGLPAELWIVGGPGREGRFEDEIHREVKRRKLEESVHFVGVVPNPVLAEYMAAADVFCLASTREGWPNVVHEALGCGTPVVASDVGGVPDLIPSPEFGRVVPAGDQAALDAALRDACARAWDREAIAAWARSRSWTEVAAEALAEFQAMCAG